ncbi:MAG: arginase family protein [Gammaproteobacteria bacterium]|nr:arginase family protein [Gammaproteobacteria bacterium]
MRSRRKMKAFGVALDASDDPMNLQLKRASALGAGIGAQPAYADPYDALMQSGVTRHRLEPAGKVPIPSWLGPRPLLADLPLVDPGHFRRFYEEQGFSRISEDVRNFVRERIFPDLPAMIGIDHSSTGGVIAALSERYGPEKLCVVVLDRHFDAIPLSYRLDMRPLHAPDTSFGMPETMPFSTIAADACCCGNFWSHLLDAGLLLPRNLIVIAVADYPGPDCAVDRQSRFREAYMALEKRGCRFFTLRQFAGPYRHRLAQFIDDAVAAPHVYVSLDVDVGSWNCVHAARYMDGPGISREQLLEIASLLAAKIRHGNASLAGLDVMEFNMHFLGMQTGDGTRDETLEAVHAFLDTLLPDAGNRAGESAEEPDSALCVEEQT